MSRATPNPFPHNPLLKRQLPELNGMAQRLGETASISGVGGLIANQNPQGVVISPPVTLPRGAWALAAIVDGGPNGEDDYTDARYWVMSIVLGQAAGAVGTDVTKPYGDNTFYAKFWTTATHLPEAVANTHRLLGTPSSAILSSSGVDKTAQLCRVYTLDAGKPAGIPDNENANTVLILEPIGIDAFFPVYVEWVGGSDGNSTTVASWTYFVYADSDRTQRLNNAAIQPERSAARIVEGTVNKATNGSVGVGYVNRDGTVHLWDCQETRVKKVCT